MPSKKCEHDRQRNLCKDCGGGSICEHDRQRSKCKDCGGGSICEHNRQRSQCKECGGSSICEHNRVRSHCKECGGSSFCEHGRQRSYCKDCGGSSICEHDRRRSYCKQCGGSALCKSSWCETYKNPKCDGYCTRCFVHLFPDTPNTRNYKTKEKDVVDRVKEAFPDFTWYHDKRVQDGCSLRRPDLLLDLGSHILIVEIDEYKHSEYDCSCENKRLMEISQDLQHRPIVFIRFNPDAYTNEQGELVKSCWKLNKTTGLLSIMKTKKKEWAARIDTLKEQIQYWVTNSTEKTVEIVQLFYDMNSDE